MIVLNAAKHQASGVETYMGRHMAISPEPAREVVYLQNYENGGGGRSIQKHRETRTMRPKAHWSPRWPNNNIRKKRSTEKVLSSAKGCVVTRVCLGKVATCELKENLKKRTTGPGKGAEGYEMSGRPPTRFLRSCSLKR